MTATGAWLRVVLYDMRDVDFDHFETPLRYMRSSIGYFTAVLEKQPGFQAAHWGVDLDDAKVAAVTHWTSLKAIEAAAGELRRLQADAEAHGIHRTHVQNIELFPAASDPDVRGLEVAAESWLRLVTYAAGAVGGHPEEYVVGHIKDFLGVLGDQPGFHRGYWGRDRAAGVVAAVTYWDSRRAIMSAAPALKQLQADAFSQGVRPLDVRNIHLFAVTPPRNGAGPRASSTRAVDGFVDAVRRRRPDG